MEIAKKIETAFYLLSSKRVIINHDNYIYKPLLFRNNAILFANDWYLEKTITKKRFILSNFFLTRISFKEELSLIL